MTVAPVLPSLYGISHQGVNCYLIAEEELILIDTGTPDTGERVLNVLRGLGRHPVDLAQILVTHCHSDHAGSLAQLKAATGAPASMHPRDAAMVRSGRALRPMHAAPGLINRALYGVYQRVASECVEPAEIEREVEDGDTVAGGLRAIHAPGHSAGQLAYFWPRHGGVLFAADAAVNWAGLRLTHVHEDVEQAERTLAGLAALDFQVACFGHGTPIVHDAGTRFRHAFG